MEAAELALLLDRGLDARLGPERALHSRSVAALAARYCAALSLDPARGRAAGLAHDLCRELPKAAQRLLAAEYSGPCPPSAIQSGHAAHGPAAAALLVRDYGVEDGELLDAVASHTFGRPGMCDLAILLYCADKLEPGRGQVPAGLREELEGMEPRAMLRRVMELSMAWLRAREREIAPETLLLYTELTGSGPAA